MEKYRVNLLFLRWGLFIARTAEMKRDRMSESSDEVRDMKSREI